MNEDAKNSLAFKLGKLMIAVGWVDGNLDHDEISAMKSMLFRLKDVSASDWGELEILMENPVEKADVGSYLADVIDSLKTDKDKDYVIVHLKELIEADGKVTSVEQSMFDAIKTAVYEKPTGLLSMLTGFSKNIIKKSAVLMQDNQKREEDLDVYLHNKILYDLKKKFPEQKQEKFNEKELKKWSAGAGLLGRVAMVDGNFDEDEQKSIVSIIESTWNVDSKLAYIIGALVKKRVEDGEVDIHQSVNYEYLACNYFEETDYDERKKFLELLFQVANASEKTSFQEIEDIRAISMDLKVSHKDYIAAKLTISRADRGGM